MSWRVDSQGQGAMGGAQAQPCLRPQRHGVANTRMLIGRWHNRFVHLPMELATRTRKEVDTHGDLWLSVVEATGQPRAFR